MPSGQMMTKKYFHFTIFVISEMVNDSIGKRLFYEVIKIYSTRWNERGLNSLNYWKFEQPVTK